MQGQVFDGQHMLSARDVVVVGEKIASVSLKAEVPAGSEELDGTGKTLLPGLIDSHVHVHSAEHLQQMAVFGVTTGLDMMDSPQSGLALKARASPG